MSKAIIQLPVSVYKFHSGKVDKIADNAFVLLKQNTGFNFDFLLLENDGSNLLIAAVENVLNVTYHVRSRRVFFDIEYNRKLLNIMIEFQSCEHTIQLINIFFKCKFENANNKRAIASDIEDIDNLIAYAEIPDDNDADGQDETFNDDEQEDRSSGKGGSNSFLRIGKNSKKTFVMKNFTEHSELGLFGGSDGCTFEMSLNDIYDTNGKTFITGDMLTADSDHSMLLLDNQKSGRLYQLSLDRALVSNEAQASLPITKLMHFHAGDSSEPVIAAFNERDTMLLDRRTKELVAQRSEYKTPNGFISGATSRNGKLAMGSSNGIVRLYKNPALKRATVNFQVSAGKDPVTAVDVSSDECWVLATCPYFLALFGVMAASTGKLAFDAPMKADKPGVTHLTLKPQDQQRVAEHCGGALPPFANARFEEKGGKVTAIVASIGPALVRWTFANACAGRQRYAIKVVADDPIVDEAPFEETLGIVYISPRLVSVARNG